MILRTPRLELRPIEAGDADALWPFVSLPDLPRLMDWDAHTSLDETAAFIAAMEAGRAEGTELVFVVRHEGTLVGLVGLHGIRRRTRAWRVDRAEMGYWIGPPHQGRGFVTEAAGEVLRHAFDDLGLHKVTIGHLDGNERSRRVIEKLGFRFVGRQRHHAFRFERWWDHLAYELCADERAPAKSPSAAEPT